jgi:hypothetical protein
MKNPFEKIKTRKTNRTFAAMFKLWFGHLGWKGLPMLWWLHNKAKGH